MRLRRNRKTAYVFILPNNGILSAGEMTPEEAHEFALAVSKNFYQDLNSVLDAAHNQAKP